MNIKMFLFFCLCLCPVVVYSVIIQYKVTIVGSTNEFPEPGEIITREASMTGEMYTTEKEWLDYYKKLRRQIWMPLENSITYETSEITQ